MATRTGHPLLGRIALHNGLITADQLAEATQERGRRADATRIGDIFVEKGWITRAQLEKLLAKQQEIVARHRASQAVERAAPVPTPPVPVPPESPDPPAPAPSPEAPPSEPGTAAAAAKPARPV